MPRKIDQTKWQGYFEQRALGKAIKPAALAAGLSPEAAYRFERGDPDSTGMAAARALGYSRVGDVVVARELSADAKRALDDFEFFRRRYFGRLSVPWQIEAGERVVTELTTPDKTYMVVNAPPGGGKSTLFTHDLVCWVIVRDRTIRTMLGSRTQKQGDTYGRRVRSSLERDRVQVLPAKLIAQGWSVQPTGYLAGDFGPFAPAERETLWRVDQFTVLAESGVDLGSKEATVTTYGMDSEYLGGRFDLALWDDLVTKRNTRTAAMREKLEDQWEAESETRIEPGGVMVLQGQRVGAEDLYHFCLNQKDADGNQVYVHVKYAAHNESAAKHEHGVDAPPYPEGCLLDPMRLPHKTVANVKAKNPGLFKLAYQQEDGDPSMLLIDPLWITGGIGEDGTEYAGCRDLDRAIGEVPEILPGRGWSVVTVDPSPTEWWSVQWWGYEPGSGNRYLLDHHHAIMSSTGLLTMDLDTKKYAGVLDEWHERSVLEGFRITHVIVEQNAAQRFLLQSPIVQRWMTDKSVVITPHDTHRNKQDPKYGVDSLKPVYRDGKVRLPAAHDPWTVQRTEDLIYEVTHYPDANRTDCLMAQWFFEYAIAKQWTASLHNRFEYPAYVTHGVQRGLHYGPSRAAS